MKKRLLSLLTALCLLLYGIPISAGATEEAPISEVRGTYINPLYAEFSQSMDAIPEPIADTAGNSGNAATRLYTSSYCTTLEEAAAILRSGMEQRTPTVTVHYKTTDADPAKDLYLRLFLSAQEETGVSTQGDYLRWCYGGMKYRRTGFASDGYYWYTYVFSISYYTTAAQEAYVTERVGRILERFSFTEQTSEYVKIKTIYDYICDNVSYDESGLDAFLEAEASNTLTDTNYLIFTAYKALSQGTSVCQGYALLLYRMLLQSGISSRLIGGTAGGGAHAWNIAQIDTLFYNVDSTWDSAYRQSGAAYQYFLKCGDHFPGHTRYSQAAANVPDYTSEAFNALYPMSGADYVPRECQAHSLTESPYLAPTCAEAGREAGSVCEVCGYTQGRANIPPTGSHSWDNGAETLPATCREPGVWTQTCTVCGDTKCSELPPLTTHTYDGGTVTQEATCAAAGVKTYTCTVCGETRTEPVPKLTAHAYDGGTVTQKATCAAAGVKTYTCTVCGETRTEPVPRLTAHTYDGGKITKAPTAAHSGIKTYTCTVCGISKTETIAKLPSAPGSTPTEEPSPSPDPTTPPDTLPFEDVADDAYYHASVAWAVAQGVTRGTTETTFSPDNSCTRSQAVTFLYRAAGSPTPGGTKNSFTDIMADDYYYHAVLWAAEQGITKGTGSGSTFSPDDTCTRAQIVTFLYRAAGSPTPGGTKNPFTDIMADDYYYHAVLWAAEQGITKGTGSGSTFSPDDTCTRAQIVTFLYRSISV